MDRIRKLLRGTIVFNSVLKTRLSWVWPAILIGLVLSASIALSAEKESELPSSKTAPSADYSLLNGTWKGVYFIYPNLMGLELQISSEPNGAVSGVLKYYPAVKLRSAFGQPKAGSYHISGQFNEPSRSFLLTPGDWIEKPPMAGGLAPLTGVLGVKTKRLAGLFEFKNAPNPMFFILAPGSDGDRLIAEISHSAYPAPLARERWQQSTPQERVRFALQRQLQQLKTMPHPYGRRGDQLKLLEEKLEQRLAALPGGGADSEARPKVWEAPSVDKLRDWASRLKQEMPGLNLRSTVMEKLYIPARNLFEDNYFKEHFGLTYEEMDASQRKAVASSFMQHARDLNDYEFLAYPFQNVFFEPDITVSIHWQRTFRSWMNAMQASLTTLPAETQSFSNLSAAESTADAELSFLWPSEKTKFHTTLAEVRTRLAGSVVTLRADRLIATASGKAGARELAGWQTQEKDILQYLSTAERDNFQQRIDTRLDKILEELVAANVRSLATLGHGLDALRAGNDWYREVKRSYDFALTRPPIQEALRQFYQVRAKNLIEAKPSIIAQIDEAEQETQVQSLLEFCLAYLGDADSETGVAIRQHAKQRLAFIQHAAAVARVGTGPFGLDYPGAAYLNALYRNDTARLAQEDRAVAEPLAFAMTQMLHATHMDALASLFSGGVLPRGGFTQLMTDQMRRFSIAEPLTGFFIVAYERVYPKCMDADPVVFKETTTWDTVVTNGFGAEIASYPNSETNYYRVNKRFADAFRKVGPGTNPDQIDFTTQLFGPLLSKDVTEPLHTVTETVRGLRMAMTQNACDSPLIKTLEKNMIAHVMAN